MGHIHGRQVPYPLYCHCGFFLVHFSFSFWITPSSVQELCLALHSRITPDGAEGPYGVPGIQSGLPVCRANAFPLVSITLALFSRSDSDSQTDVREIDLDWAELLLLAFYLIHVMCISDVDDVDYKTAFFFGHRDSTEVKGSLASMWLWRLLSLEKESAFLLFNASKTLCGF